MIRLDFEGIGTKWQIDIYEELSKEKKDSVLLAVKRRIEDFDQNYSRFREDSLIMKMSREKGDFILPEDAKPMLDLYEKLYKLTDGFFTPLVGNLLSDAGYDAHYTFKQKKILSAAPLWENTLIYNFPNITLKAPAILDFGAGGKGYLVDLVAEVLEKNGIHEYCVDAGGDILHKGKNILKVGLENPENINQVIGVLPLQNESICGSAGNRRAWGDFTHIINPKTAKSPNAIIAVWVVSSSALLSDALATCLFFVPADKLKSVFDFEYMLIHKDLSFEKSSGFRGEIFTGETQN